MNALPSTPRRHRRPRAARIVAAAAVLATVLGSPRAARADEAVVVAAGDTLSVIAARHGTTAAALVAANGLGSPDRILVGQRLIVPTGSGDLAGIAAGAPRAGFGWHVVAPGETLFGLALRAGTTVDALVLVNDLPSLGLWAGQRILLPVPAPPAAPPPPAAEPVAPSGPRRIVVDLSDQLLTAFQGDVPLRTFVVSTGSPWTPTPTGTYAIYARLPLQDMFGPGYALDDVPDVQYFTGAYAIHGAYWHNEFGRPMTHGCVNMLPWDARWLWDWADLGTPVAVVP